jgi:GTPase SAR1 family protein
MNSEIKSPFKLLDSYGKEDKEIFFGRHSEIEELYDRVFETDLILLYGASGTGKTSLINCGLSNQFNSVDWLPIQIRRNDNLVRDMHKAIQEEAVHPVEEEQSIQQKLRSLYLDYFKPVYLIFDQFEELFIQGEKEEQRRFFEEVKAILLAGIQCKVLISMREEWIASLSDFELIIPSLFDNRQRIEKMTRLNLQNVIRKTTEAFDIELVDDEETIHQIIKNIQDPKQGVELANLQIYLDKLYHNDYERREGQKRPLRFDPELVGSARKLEDVLSDFLHEQLELLEKELNDKFKILQKGVPFDILLVLVTEDGTKKKMNIELVREQLQRRKNIDPEVVNYCVNRFNEMRIIRILVEA